MLVEVLEALFVALMVPVTAYLIRHYIFTLAVLQYDQRAKNSQETKSASYQPVVSVLIPAHNEEQVIDRTLSRMAQLEYPKNKLQIIVIDDASTDRTEEISEQYAKLYGFFEVVHRSREEGGHGKASALNAVLPKVRGEIIVCFDADYYPQKDVIEKLVRMFVDAKVGAVQGRVTVLNEPQNVVTRLVALERIGGYRVDQQARDSLGLIPQFGGTAGAVRRSLLERLGGWDESVLTEDTELTFRIYLAGYKVRYVLDAESYEEAVASWQAYWKQRYRWAKGHMQVAFKYLFKVLGSKKLRLREKIDGLLLLNVYFMPVLAVFSWAIGVALFLLNPSKSFNPLWFLPSISLYSFVGNFAPFFEVGIGAYLDRRTRAYWLIPLLLYTFLYNTLICTKAFIDLLLGKTLGRSGQDSWGKTMHFGRMRVREQEI